MIEITSGIVRILKPNGETSGTGFVLTDDGLIATCAHVVESTEAGAGDIVSLIFHHSGDEASAVVEPDGWRDPETEDIAILKINGPLPRSVKPLPLSPSANTANHPFETFGFPDANPDEGLWGAGHILRQTTLGGVRVLQLQSQEVTPGFSGAPIWDTVTQHIVGMVTAITCPDNHGRLVQTAFATPLDELSKVWPSLYEYIVAFSRTSTSGQFPNQAAFREDWGEAIDVWGFHGRQEELAELEQWIVTDRPAAGFR